MLLNHEARGFARSLFLSLSFTLWAFSPEFPSAAFSPGNYLSEYISQMLYLHRIHTMEYSANWEDYGDGWMMKHIHIYALGRFPKMQVELATSVHTVASQILLRR
jgi:hypothetical protein